MASFAKIEPYIQDIQIALIDLQKAFLERSGHPSVEDEEWIIKQCFGRIGANISAVNEVCTGQEYLFELEDNIQRDISMSYLVAEEERLERSMPESRAAYAADMARAG